MGLGYSRYINQFKNEPAVAFAKTNSSENAHMQLPAQSLDTKHFLHVP